MEELLGVGKADPSGEGTGGSFSVSYRVRKKESEAFLKALDLDRILNSDDDLDLLEVINRETTAFAQEQRLNHHCAKSRMRQVVSIVDHGTVKVERKPGDKVLKVHYMILELADGGDVRGHLKQNSHNDLMAKFGYLKDVILGVGQLHEEEISHQDLKPSNVMVFQKFGAKVGDLGRASIKGYQGGAYEGWVVRGDITYAPPEQLYGVVPEEWRDRHERSDLYQFGSLVTFLLFGISLNSMIKERMPSAIGPKCWFPEEGGGSTYLQALPYLQQAFFEGLEECRSSLPEWASAKVIELIVQCSNPDYTLRGSRKVLGKSQDLGLGLNRFVSVLENLRTEAAKQSRFEAKRRGVQ
ncbi:protein kinase [Pseudomonas kurunegalensis]|uniref:protein kinase domain-containing protein n=1 Tax=Pseudomonas kurunegalensis TaxID=485880 RepID=UPI003558A211